MSINGVLEDLPLADVLQFIHLGQRSGTLYMWRSDDSRAEISFHDGRIVSAWTPGQHRLGDQLVEAGLLESAVLAESLHFQRGEGKGKTIGQILIDRGAVPRDEVHRRVKGQIQDTVFDLVTWKHGNFHFEVDELNLLDDFAIEPGELLDDLDLNTQMLLLEATRIFDERQRNAELAAEADVEEETDAELDERLQRAGLARQRDLDQADTRPMRRIDDDQRLTGAPELVRCQLVSDDLGLLDELRAALSTERIKLASVRLREAGTRVPGETDAPMVILDLRGSMVAPESIASLARTRPASPVIALVSHTQAIPPAYEAGAVAAVGPSITSLIAACNNLLRVLSQPATQGTFGYGHRDGFRRFQRVVFDVQSGLQSATMALNLMHVISESVDRAVLFLVQGERMVAVGAFGFNENGRPLAEATRGLKLIPAPSSGLRRAFDDGKPLTLSFDEAALPFDFADLLGPPTVDQVVIFPVRGAERPISVIYTDNGTLDEEIQDVRILELATSQVGAAFENELLRQQQDDRVFDVDQQAFDRMGRS